MIYGQRIQIPPVRVIRSITSNTYCVPAALSAILRKNVDDVMPLINEHLGDVDVSGVYHGIALRILKDQGYTVKELTYADQFSVRELIKRLPMEHIFFTVIQRHVLVIQNRLVIDNGNPTGISPDAYYRRNARVQNCYEITEPTRSDLMI